VWIFHLLHILLILRVAVFNLKINFELLSFILFELSYDLRCVSSGVVTHVTFVRAIPDLTFDFMDLIFGSSRMFHMNLNFGSETLMLLLFRHVLIIDGLMSFSMFVFVYNLDVCSPRYYNTRFGHLIF
jgi:hypothetical protein